MAVSPTLTADERAALAGVSTLARYLSPVPDVDIATALINQVTFTYPLAQLTVDNTSADWADVQEGDTVYVGTSAGLSDIGIYRVRLNGNSTTIFLGETSSQDVGLLPVAIRTASFANNQHITVKRRFDLWSVLPTINVATGAIREDYDRTPGTNNTTPPPLADIVINGRRNHLATLIENGSTFPLEAIVTPTSWTTSSGETYTYEWLVPASGWSSVTGDTTDTLTADVEPGNYILVLNLTGDDSGLTQRIVYVHIHDNDVNPPLVISEMPRSDVRDRTGRRMSFDMYGSGLSSVAHGACVIYFEMATWANQWVNSTTLLNEALDISETGVDVDSGAVFTGGDIILVDAEQMLIGSISTNTLTVTRAYNGTSAAVHADNSMVYVYRPATDVPTATRQFVGWAQRHDKNTGDGLRQATIEIISPSFLLGMLSIATQIIKVHATPTTWQQAVAGLMSASFLAWYMLRWRCANLLRLFNFTPFSVTATGQRLPSWTIDKGTLLQQIQNLATERGNFGCDSEGEFYFLRHPNLISYASRSSVVVRDELDASLYVSASNPREMQNRVQQVRGEVFHWNGSASSPTPGYSDSPKAPGQGASQIKLSSQVATNQAELEQLTGDRYAQANNPYPNVGYDIQRNRDVIEPAHMQFVLLNIPDYLNANGSEYESNIIPATVTKTHNPDGTSDMKVTGEGETHNLAGDFVPVPVGNDSLFMPPFTPLSIDPLPLPSLGDNSVSVPSGVPSAGGATVSPGLGAIWVTADGTAVQRTFDITEEPPTVEDITPVGGTATTFVMIVHNKAKNFSRGAYLLGNDGSESYILYTTDVYADEIAWSEGAAFGGIATQIESIGLESLNGTVNAYGTGADPVISTYDFDNQPPDFEINTDEPTWSDLATLDSDGFIDSGVLDTGSGETSWIIIDFLIPVTGLAGVRMVFDDDAPKAFVVSTDGGNSSGTNITPEAIGGGEYIIDAPFASYTGDLIRVNVRQHPTTTIAAFKLLRFEVTEVTTGDAVVYYSVDYGASTTDITVGDTPGVDGAFCMSRYGVVSLAAVDTKLRIAGLAGGAYSDEADGGTAGTYPIAARIPWYRIGSSATNNSATPDYYIASAAAVSSETLWKVVSGTKTAITPAVTGTDAIGVNSNCIGTYGKNRINFVGDVSGVRYIFSSKTSGAAWTNTQIDAVNSIRAQRFSPSGLIWLACTGADLQYSDDGGVTWESRTVPDGGLFGEIFG